MNPQKTSAKDFFLNLGAIVALYTVVISLINLLFTVINRAYPQIINNYQSSQSISWPVAVLVIFFPIFILLMWLLEKGYIAEPEKRQLAVKRWLTYITLFISGIALAIDLVTILYYFIDGQELTIGFVLKVIVVFVIASGVFMYFISEIKEKLTASSRKVWTVVALLVIILSISWGFAVLGSPRTQRLLKYDEQKVNDLMTINQYVISYYESHAGLPGALSDLAESNNYFVAPTDLQSGKPYEYILIGQSAKAYQLCAEFNKSTLDSANSGITRPAYVGGTFWTHPAGRYCFTQTIDISKYPAIKR